MDPLSAIAGGITIAGLVKACLEAFDLVRAARDQPREYRRLMLRLSLERARLYLWGRALGLDAEHGPVREELRDASLEPLLRSVLEEILELFCDGDKLQGKYGSAVTKDESTQLPLGIDEAPPSSTNFAAAFSHFGLSQKQPTPIAKKLIGKTKWVFRDRKSFDTLIRELRTLIDGLQDVTRSLSAVAHQESMMKDSIRQIVDPDTLSLVSEEFQTDYPAISEAASERADVMSLATTRRREMEDWVSSIGPTEGITSPQESALEQLTITELQAFTRKLLAQIGNLNVAQGQPTAGGTLTTPSVTPRASKANTVAENVAKTGAANDESIESGLSTPHQDRAEPESASELRTLPAEATEERNTQSGSTTPIREDHGILYTDTLGVCTYIPAGYSLKWWNPEERPIFLLGSVFDSYSLGKWIYGWTAYTYGARTPMAEMAEELQQSLATFAARMERASDGAMHARHRAERQIFADFHEAGMLLWRRLDYILKVCEGFMLQGASGRTLSEREGTVFVRSIFGRERELESTERLMSDWRLWIMRFDENYDSRVPSRPRWGAHRTRHGHPLM